MAVAFLPFNVWTIRTGFFLVRLFLVRPDKREVLSGSTFEVLISSGTNHGRLRRYRYSQAVYVHDYGYLIRCKKSASLNNFVPYFRALSVLVPPGLAPMTRKSVWRDTFSDTLPPC